ncbi:MAG: hypothetical protein ACRD2B_17705 [Terriglobia bacterium]
MSLKSRFMQFGIVSCLALLACALVPRASFGQAWSGIIDPSRAINWSGAGIPGGIPNRTTICATISPSGKTDATDMDAIDNAIANCPAGEVVELSAGTFTITGGISFEDVSNVTLRGAGPDKTKLVFTGPGTHGCGATADVCIYGNGGWVQGYPAQALWTAGFAQGTSVITIGAVTGSITPAVGQIIILDQRDDSIGICPESGGTGDCASASGATESGNTVTITTSLPHGFSVGETVGIGGPTSTAQNPTLMPSNATVMLVSSASCASNTVTMNFTTEPSLEAGEIVAVSGVDPAGYDGAYTIASVSNGGGTITYSIGSCPTTYVSGGMAIEPASYVGEYAVSAVYDTATSSFNSTAGFSDSNSTQFQYADPASGLAASGGGQATADTGGVYNSCVGGPTCSMEPGSGFPDVGRSCPDLNNGAGGTAECATGEISYRSQEEIKQITAVNGSQLTISPPLYMPNWRFPQKPSIWWTGANYDTLDGIESMTLDYAEDQGSSETSGVDFYRAYECWMRNIRSLHGNEAHVYIRQGSARDEVLDSYFFGSKGSDAQSYGIEMYEGSEDNLIENNICQDVIGCIMPGGVWGSVIAYNYSVEAGALPVDWLRPGLTENHDFGGMNLFEGNDMPFASLDDIHGSSTAETSFRNRLRGTDTSKSASLVAVSDSAFNRFANFVGNILGTSGAETSYETAAPFASGYVWEIGGETDNGATPYDPITTSSLLRWGNYDVATGAVHWCGNSSDPGWTTTCASKSEIPDTAFTDVNANAVPSSTVLPASFYRVSEPAFWQTPWGTSPWPSIGPDVTGGTAPDGLAGYSYTIPAQECFADTPIDPAYQQTFSVSGASWSSGTATLTISSNLLYEGDVVTVSGINPSGYNGTFEITAGAPAPPPQSAFVLIAGSAPGPGAVCVFETYVTSSGGETLPSPNGNCQNILSGADEGLQVDSPGSEAGVTGWNVYMTVANGSTYHLQNPSPLSLTANWSQTTAVNTTTTQPPTASTAQGTTISYSLATNPGSYVSSGSVGWPNILNFNADLCYPEARKPKYVQAGSISGGSVE